MKNVVLFLVLALVPLLTFALSVPESAKSSSVPDSSFDSSRIINEILYASRTGKKVNISVGHTVELNKIAADPELKKLAVEGGVVLDQRSTSEDSIFIKARNYISAKLCSIGVLKCDSGTDSEQRNGSWGTGSHSNSRDISVGPSQPGSLPFSPVHQNPDRSNYYPSEVQGGVVQKSECTCVPVYQCSSYDIVSDGNRNNGYNPGYGRPSHGQVGQNIDPRRTTADGNTNTNATVVEALLTVLDTRAIADEPSSVGNRRKREAPRIVSSSKQCPDHYVCCRRPMAPVNKQPGMGGGNYYPPPSHNKNDVCGQRNTYGINGRVVNEAASTYSNGNSDTAFGEYPWQVAVLRKEGGEHVFVCGGSLINGRYVLTAAHCVQSHRPELLRVRLGEYDVSSEGEFYAHQDMNVETVAIHPEFNSGNLVNDIALIKMDNFVETSGRYPHIGPICLPEKYSEFSGKRCVVTGWGKDAWGSQGKFQHRLQKVDLPVLNHYDCEQKLKRTKLGSNFVLHSGFMCAGGEPSKDSCRGDGGGPLACEVGGVWQLAGITSWGVGCGAPDVPGIYVMVSSYLDWIRQSIDMNSGNWARISKR